MSSWWVRIGGVMEGWWVEWVVLVVVLVGIDCVDMDELQRQERELKEWKRLYEEISRRMRESRMLCNC